MPKVDDGGNNEKNEKIIRKEKKKRRRRYWTINMSFGIFDKTFGVFKWLDWLSIKENVGVALWPLLREY